jgi:hypothetical protein
MDLHLDPLALEHFGELTPLRKHHERVESRAVDPRRDRQKLTVGSVSPSGRMEE